MSHICIAANPTGIVVASDRFVTQHPDPFTLHSPYVRGDAKDKCGRIPEKGIVWALCGLLAIQQTDTIRSLTQNLTTCQSVDQALDAFRREVVAVYDPKSSVTHSTTVFVGQRKEGKSTIWVLDVIKGVPQLRRHDIDAQNSWIYQAGCLSDRVLFPSPLDLAAMGFEEMRDLARGQVQKAIDLDSQMDEADLNYQRRVGGEILSYGIRLRQSPPARPAGGRY